MPLLECIYVKFYLPILVLFVCMLKEDSDYGLTLDAIS